MRSYAAYVCLVLMTFDRVLAGEAVVARPLTGPLTVLVVLAVALVVAIGLWSSRIRRDGYHRTKSNYPNDTRAAEPGRSSTRGTFQSPVP